MYMARPPCDIPLVCLKGGKMIQKESALRNENANPPKKNERFGITRAVEKCDPQKTPKTKEKSLESKERP
jgi:hypothetical protein